MVTRSCSVYVFPFSEIFITRFGPSHLGASLHLCARLPSLGWTRTNESKLNLVTSWRCLSFSVCSDFSRLTSCRFTISTILSCADISRSICPCVEPDNGDDKVESLFSVGGRKIRFRSKSMRFPNTMVAGATLNEVCNAAFMIRCTNGISSGQLVTIFSSLTKSDRKRVTSLLYVKRYKKGVRSVRSGRT